MLAYMKNRLREESENNDRENDGKREEQKDLKVKAENLKPEEDEESSDAVRLKRIVEVQLEILNDKAIKDDMKKENVAEDSLREKRNAAVLLWRECHRMDRIGSDLKIPYYCQQLVVKIYNRAGKVAAFKEATTEVMRSVLIATSFYTAFKLCRLGLNVDNLCVKCGISFEQLKLGYNIFMENWTAIQVTLDQVQSCRSSSLPSLKGSNCSNNSYSSSGSSSESSSPNSPNIVHPVAQQQLSSLAVMSAIPSTPILVRQLEQPRGKLSPTSVSTSVKIYQTPAHFYKNSCNNISNAQQMQPSSALGLQKFQEQVKQQQYQELVAQQQRQLQQDQSLRAKVVESKGPYHVSPTSKHQKEIRTGAMNGRRYEDITFSRHMYPGLGYHHPHGSDNYQSLHHQSLFHEQHQSTRRSSVGRMSRGSELARQLSTNLTSDHERGYPNDQPRPTHIQVQALPQRNLGHIATANNNTITLTGNSVDNTILYNELHNGRQQTHHHQQLQAQQYRSTLIPSSPMTRMLLK
jgi:hypothetical protein